MITKTMLYKIDENSAIIKTQKYVEVDGEVFTVSVPNVALYQNSERGRAEIAAALSEPYLSAVMAVWGETPTVIEDNLMEG